MGDAGEDDGADDSNHYAYESTEDGDKSGLDEELHQDVLRGGTYGFADADFPRPFGDADQHDVHDPNAADNEGDDSHRA